ncbi:hypothetical protein K491DRAFT_784010 [Lophiostoma macrostomum CBS 122681]|uniref:Uncharacterized protein n=1 Tax=Lophiostoma macrostomum CBS 122681 TaxID=1314788 RepID=A0A6A6SL38_9PLEO|nr:hypothetical protein K491DRAFT_784010 [Lophiostoma macrostomum CBS 122681]
MPPKKRASKAAPETAADDSATPAFKRLRAAVDEVQAERGAWMQEKPILQKQFKNAVRSKEEMTGAIESVYLKAFGSVQFREYLAVDDDIATTLEAAITNLQAIIRQAEDIIDHREADIRHLEDENRIAGQLVRLSEVRYGNLEAKVKTLEAQKNTKDERINSIMNLRKKIKTSEDVYKERYEQEKEKRRQAEADLSKYRQIEAIMKGNQGVKTAQT